MREEGDEQGEEAGSCDIKQLHDDSQLGRISTET